MKPCHADWNSNNQGCHYELQAGISIGYHEHEPWLLLQETKKHRTKETSYCQSQKTVNNWKISGILIVYWPIKIKFRTREQTSKQQTNYRCCWRFSYPCLIGLFLATQEHSINISSVHGFLSFTVTVEFPPTNCPNPATWNLSDSPDKTTAKLWKVSRVGEHKVISQGICVSQVGEHISLGICVSLVREHISLGICDFQVEEHISLGVCVSQLGEHISLGICVSKLGEHISLGIHVPGWGNTYH